jgi:hypothetical protein
MLDRVKLTYASQLTEEQTQEASKELINKTFTKLEYPKAVKLRVDPIISGQKYCVFTFVPSSGAKPDNDGAFGVVKFRGAFPCVEDSEERCTYLIQNVDSYNENFITFVGHDFPLTLDPKYVEKTKEISIRNKMDTVARENIKKQREQERKEMEEIQDRQKQLLADTTEHKATAIDDLDYYTTLRTKRASLRMFVEETERKLKDASKSIKQTSQEINDLDEKYPEYKKQYEEKYRTALDAVGAAHDPNTPAGKMIEYMK